MAGVLKVEAILMQRTGLELYGITKDSDASLISTPGARNVRASLQRFVNILLAIAGGAIRGRLRIGIDDSTGVAATATITCTQANCTAGDVLFIGKTPITGVAGTPDPYAGQYSISTSDANVATTIAAAINSYGPFRGRFTASVSTNVVTVTSVAVGTLGNEHTLVKQVTTAGAFTLSGATFTGGRDPGDKQSLTAALGGALTANDTVTIGSVVLTAKAAPVGENQFAATVSAAADGAALAAAINAHSKLKGLLLASGTSTVTIAMRQGGRIGALVSISKSAAQITLSAASFAPTTTEAWAASPVELAFGAL